MLNICHPILNKQQIYQGKALFYIGLNIDFRINIEFDLLTGDLYLRWNNTGLWRTFCVDYLRYIGSEDMLLSSSAGTIIKDQLSHLAPPNFAPGTIIYSVNMPDYRNNVKKYDYNPINIADFDNPNSGVYNPRRWGIKFAMYNTGTNTIPGGRPYHPLEVYESVKEVRPLSNAYNINTNVGNMVIYTPTYATKTKIRFFLRGIGRGSDTSNITIICRYILDNEAKELGII